MDIYGKLYWLTRLDGIRGLIIFLAILAFITCIVIIIWAAASSDFDEFENGDKIKERKRLRNLWRSKIKWLAPIGFLFLIISVLIPSKNEMIFIVAGGKTIDWVQKDTSICKIPAQTTEIISKFLEKQIRELDKNEIKNKDKDKD